MSRPFLKGVILTLMLLVSMETRAQFVWSGDEIQGEQLMDKGVRITAVSGSGMVFGGALVGLGVYGVFAAGNVQYPDVSSALIGMGLSTALSVAVVYVGCGLILVSYPGVLAGTSCILSGKEMKKHNGYWRDVFYTGEGQSGFGLILEGNVLYRYPLPGIQARIVPGYHVNQHFFMGAGAAPAIDFNLINTEEQLGPYTLPVFADFRYSFGDRLLAPYIGVSAGMETIYKPDIYIAADAGLRIRLSQDKTNSFWVSVTGEGTSAYRRFGIKAGYSF